MKRDTRGRQERSRSAGRDSAARTMRWITPEGGGDWPQHQGNHPVLRNGHFEWGAMDFQTQLRDLWCAVRVRVTDTCLRPGPLKKERVAAGGRRVPRSPRRIRACQPAAVRPAEGAHPRGVRLQCPPRQEEGRGEPKGGSGVRWALVHGFVGNKKKIRDVQRQKQRVSVREIGLKCLVSFMDFAFSLRTFCLWVGGWMGRGVCMGRSGTSTIALYALFSHFCYVGVLATSVTPCYPL